MSVGLLLIVTIGTGGPDDEGLAAEPVQRKPALTAPVVGLQAPVDRPNLPDNDALVSWSRRIAGSTELPRWAAEAYGRAEMWMRSEAPECRISWATLAAVAQVKSAGGPLKPVPLSAEVWKRWGARATKDGEVPDKKDFHDAAFTAARYLCESGGDLSTPQGWWRAVRAYEPSKARASEVHAAAGALAAQSLRPNTTG